MQKLFKTVYMAGIVAEIVLRIPYERQRRLIPKTDQRVSRAERGLLAGLFTGMFFIPMIYMGTAWLKFANYRWAKATQVRAGSLGAMLLVAAVGVFWRSHHDLGANWSPSLEICAGQSLVTRGIYRSVRHPMYASQWLWSIGQALLLQNWIAGFASLATFLPLYLVRVPREERMMLDHFGESYQAYASQTGRVLPRIRR